MRGKLKAAEKTDLLGRIPLFEPCTAAERKRIAGLTTQVEVAEGEVLCRQGEHGREFFVLVAGSAKVQRKGRPAATLAAGEFFGELALLDDGPRTATVTMTSDGSVLVLSGTEFRGLLREAPTVAVRMLSVVGARLRELSSDPSQ